MNADKKSVALGLGVHLAALLWFVAIRTLLLKSLQLTEDAFLVVRIGTSLFCVSYAFSFALVWTRVGRIWLMLSAVIFLYCSSTVAAWLF